jgi:hypothetical protein
MLTAPIRFENAAKPQHKSDSPKYVARYGHVHLLFVILPKPIHRSEKRHEHFNIHEKCNDPRRTHRMHRPVSLSLVPVYFSASRTRPVQMGYRTTPRPMHLPLFPEPGTEDYNSPNALILLTAHVMISLPVQYKYTHNKICEVPGEASRTVFGYVHRYGSPSPLD